MRPPRPPAEPLPSVPGTGCTSFADELAAIRADASVMNTEMGLRPYRVFSVRLHWSGGAPGRGDVTRTLVAEYLPRPKVAFRTRREFGAAGYVERGVVILSELPLGLTAAEVPDLFALTVPLTPADETFLEVVADGEEAAERRRFVAVEPPERRAWDWRLVVRQQGGQRAPDGSAGPGRTL